MVGQCLIAEACSFLDCSQVNRFLPEDIPVQLLNCNASCCTENLCNQVEVNETSEEFIGKFNVIFSKIWSLYEHSNGVKFRVDNEKP